ncbi:UDP-glucose dehydrogenase family protein [Actinoplanes sp. HUAS TT8]|uniref:UDP-glucose dehydrogenase family protein n=1 Tax=Actinoplanes sp. HUAS TT8 TaxID=3447453 RepID=UPI003F51F822
MTFLGCGYLGATYAICFAELGYEVLGVDVDERKIQALAAGQVPFVEPGLSELLNRNLAAGRLAFTTDYQQAADHGDVHFICVGTPQRADESASADLTYVEAAVTSLVPHLTRDALLVGKSTVPVNTTEWVAQLAAKHAPSGVQVEVAWSPEFLQEGHALEDVLRPNRLVFGVSSPAAEAALRAAHRGVFELALQDDRQVPVVVTDPATAELVKVAANAFLATKISFINAVSAVCDAAGADVTDLAKAIGLDARIGTAFLRAGVGFGGGCLPKDIRAFQARAAELGVGHELRFLHEIDGINQRRRLHVVQLAAGLLDRTSSRPTGADLTGCTVAVLGAAFKPHTDDVRDSPALAVAGMLHQHGANVVVYDPAGMDNARRVSPHLQYAPSFEDAVSDADLVCVLTAWDEFRHADPAAIAQLVAAPRVIDGMNCLDADLWRAAGWTYRGIGRQQHS